MKAIWKYQLVISSEVQVFLIPKGAEVLTCQMQYGEPFLWVVVDTHASREDRSFAVVGTGYEIPDEKAERMTYISTVQQGLGHLVWHIMEVRI